jgi:hypothetical protein
MRRGANVASKAEGRSCFMLGVEFFGSGCILCEDVSQNILDLIRSPG